MRGFGVGGFDCLREHVFIREFGRARARIAPTVTPTSRAMSRMEGGHLATIGETLRGDRQDALAGVVLLAMPQRRLRHGAASRE